MKIIVSIIFSICTYQVVKLNKKIKKFLPTLFSGLKADLIERLHQHLLREHGEYPHERVKI